MRVLMLPSSSDFGTEESGIKRVVEAYEKYLPKYGVEFVDKGSSYDLKAVHAGMTGNDCDVAHIHGLYWTADYSGSPSYEYRANANIVQAVRSAKIITVPSGWVAETFQRDMHVNPFVLYHGIEPDEFKNPVPNSQNGGYIVWNKNRDMDVCTTEHLKMLAEKFPNNRFVTTFMRIDNIPNNVSVVGIKKHDAMMDIVKNAGLYLSTTKETFGIGILEALAWGVPVLGFDYGGNSLIVRHKETGYLAEVGNYEDLYYGLQWCLKNRSQLSKNARYDVLNNWTWDKPISQLFSIYDECVHPHNEYKKGVSVVIPLYNYADKVENAIMSAVNQTMKPDSIVVVDDGSSDNPEQKINEIKEKIDVNLKYVRQKNSGVAVARNTGIFNTDTEYIVCLDSDDKIAPSFIETCFKEIDKDRTLGVVYTGLLTVHADGRTTPSNWPTEFNYDDQVRRKNQIPTCCMFRRDFFDRTAGYRQRYAPMGAGSEDAEFWLRGCSLGYNAKKITDECLFEYSFGTGGTSKQGYKEVDWMRFAPYTRDGKHPFASPAKPEKMSHPVRQYDEPVVSVVIPVGKGHEHEIVNAIDSLEAQSFRRWEVVVVWDSENPIPEYIKKAFPFIKFTYTGKPKSGAGVARNIGAKVARGYFLMFLDADDWLYPEALEKMLAVWNNCNSIVYSDYVGKSTIKPENLQQFGERLLSYNERKNEAVIMHRSAEYDCERAQEQPTKSVYHWCLVTCLIPKKYHESIDGFDEEMESFEDVDYHWRMARKGYLYTRIGDPLVVYRFDTGTRRTLAVDSDGGQRAVKLLEYMKKKYERIDKMPCFKCGSNQSKIYQVEQTNKGDGMSDDNFVLCLYNHPNTGDHPVVGSSTGMNYGYRAGGNTFLVHKADIASMPDLFIPVDTFSKPVDKEVPDTVKEEEVVDYEARNSTLIEDSVTLQKAIDVVEKTNNEIKAKRGRKKNGKSA